MNTNFTKTLLKWHKNNPRELVWKSHTDAYSTWLSEIIMQQTRVEHGSKYYLKFKHLFPTVFDLANAPQEDVMKAWEGLGYYSRARNLHHTAKVVANEMNGEFPTTSKELQQLKGIGVYTASAIASFVFNEVSPAIDGNAYRVFSRFFGIKTPIDSTDGKKEFLSLGKEIIDPKKPGEFNQAVMNFGALVCTPKQAKCDSECPLQNECIAYTNNNVYSLPVKEKKIKQTKRYFTFFVLKQNNSTYIEERTTKDVWQNLFQFPMIETKTAQWEEALQESFLKDLSSDSYKIVRVHENFKQQLSHQTIIATFVEISLKTDNQINKFKKILLKELNTFPFPKIINDYLKKM